MTISLTIVADIPWSSSLATAASAASAAAGTEVVERSGRTPSRPVSPKLPVGPAVQDLMEKAKAAGLTLDALETWCFHHSLLSHGEYLHHLSERNAAIALRYFVENG
jgi:hypothetical protein